MKTPLFLLAIPAVLVAGPFSPPAGEPGSTAVAAGSPAIVSWATGASLERGPVDITVPEGALASFGSATDALGPADADQLDTFPVVSLGDGGAAILTFPAPIADGDGADFAVFENAFNDSFLELAFVEVSSDGENYVRFPATSLTPTDSQTGNIGGLDGTDLHHLAGKFRAGFGTPFDLSEVEGPLLNRAAVTHVRLIDVIGSIDPQYGTTDHLGNIVNDPWPTSFHTGGFDLDAVGVMNEAPTSYGDWCLFYHGQPFVPFKDDGDRDGLPARLEWALWASPRDGRPAFRLAADPSGVELVFHFHPSRQPGLLRIEGSANGTSWSEIARVQAGSWTATASGVDIAESGDLPRCIRVSLLSARTQLVRFHSEG